MCLFVESTDFKPHTHKTKIVDGITYYEVYKQFAYHHLDILKGAIETNFTYTWGKNTPSWFSRLGYLLVTFSLRKEKIEIIHGGVFHADLYPPSMGFGLIDSMSSSPSIFNMPVYFLEEDFVAYGIYGDIVLKHIYIFEDVYDSLKKKGTIRCA